MDLTQCKQHAHTTGGTITIHYQNKFKKYRQLLIKVKVNAYRLWRDSCSYCKTGINIKGHTV